MFIVHISFNSLKPNCCQTVVKCQRIFNFEIRVTKSFNKWLIQDNALLGLQLLFQNC